MSKIIVGVDESQGSTDAIALASNLAGITGSTLLLANAFPYDQLPTRTANRAFGEYLRQDSETLLERLRDAHGDPTVEVRAVPSPSPAHGLHELAEQERADLVVVGSTHTGRAGRVLPGSTAERLLHGSPCPVAVAPRDYAQRSNPELAVIGCGYDGSSSAELALDAARRLAAATGAQLRVIRGFKPLAFDTPPGNRPIGEIASYNDSLHERATEQLASAVASFEAEVETDIKVGDPADVLTEASEHLDLLLVGSRGYGPMHAVMVGGVAGRVLREAACPVLVVPRSSGDTETHSLFAQALTAHG